MTSKELRIGNYVQWNNKNFKDYFFKVQDIGLQGVDYEVNHFRLYSDIKPIELTEEILLKCGFEKGLKYFSYKDFDIDLKGWFGFNNMVANANIKYLHQLQNLYFALTGEELEIDLS